MAWSAPFSQPVDDLTRPPGVITPLERDCRIHALERRPIAFSVTNRSGHAWHQDTAGGPTSLSYHWRWSDGATIEGPRTPFVVPLPDDATTVVPLAVHAPGRTGRCLLCVDVVHEHVRWYEIACRVRFCVNPEFALPAEREVYPEPRVRRFRRGPNVVIPKVIHRLWLGDERLPEAALDLGETWRRHHPAWDMRLWSDADVPRPPALARARNVAEQADIIRYEILRRHGGVYVDTDVECLRPIDDLIGGVRAFAGYEVPGRLCNAVIGTVPGHPAYERAAALVARTAGIGISPFATATSFLTRVLEPFADVTLFRADRFYPHRWDEQPVRGAGLDSTYAVRHWAQTWLGSPVPGSGGANDDTQGAR